MKWLKRVLRVLVILLVLAGLGAGARFLVLRKKAALATAPKFGVRPLPVQVATARRGDLRQTLSYLAVVEPIREARISARLTAAGLMSGGTLLALLLYLPVLGPLFGNRFVASHGPFHLPTLTRTLPLVLHYFVSWRYLLVIIFVVGIIPALARRAPAARRRVALLLITVLLAPFLFSFLRGDHPSLRVFVNLTPVFALLVGLSAGFLETAVPALRRRTWLGILILFVYCQATFAFTRLHVRYRLAQDIGLGRKSQDIFYGYYQEHYHPHSLARELAARIRKQPGPTVLLDFDRAALPVYLEHAGVKWHAGDALAPLIADRDRVYVVTAFPNRFRVEMRRHFPHLTVEQLNAGPRFHATFRLTP